MRFILVLKLLSFMRILPPGVRIYGNVKLIADGIKRIKKGQNVKK